MAGFSATVDWDPSEVGGAGMKVMLDDSHRLLIHASVYAGIGGVQSFREDMDVDADYWSEISSYLNCGLNDDAHLLGIL